MNKIVLIKNYNDILIKNSDLDLPQKTLQRLNYFKDDKKRDDFLSAHYQTNKLINHFFGISDINIIYEKSKKPFVLDEKVFFSRSYSDNFLAVIIDNKSDVGIDLERVRKVDYNVLKYFFTQNEIDLINNSYDKDLMFTIIWTRKESYIKYLGVGLSFPLKRIDVSPQNNNLFDSYSNLNCYINTYIIDELVLSVCSKNKIMDNEIMKMGWENEKKYN